MTIDEETIRQMQGVARTVYTVRPELLMNDATFGEIPWVWASSPEQEQDDWRHRFWHAPGGEIIGWGWAFLPHETPQTDGTTRPFRRANLAWLVHPEHSEVFGEILDWYDEQAEGLERVVSVRAAHTEALALVAAHGYAVNEQQAGDQGYWIQLNGRDLDEIETPAVPEGYRVRTAAEVGTEAAYRAHADAWHPSTLTLEAMERTQRTESYRADLHLVVVTDDGAPVASTTIWLDEETGSAEFEPVGTHPEHRRKGVARAMLLHGMHAAKAAGARRMLVACLGAAGHPAARELYYSVGFECFTTDVPYLKQP